ncbi:MAG: CDP-glucose 4,6-dehydratase [Candidatus Thermoplasmatota archaeon]|nr:CDP-glucose 4,6-dehydratase [Candidatus Thermoplasmatota archaeon]
MALNFSFYKGKRILITGHTGFMGSWLTKWLTMLQADVTGYSLDPPTKPNMYEALTLSSEISDIRGDVRNTDLLRKTIQKFQPEIVFHLAAQPIVLESYDNPVETFDTNVTGTVNLLNELRKVESVKTIVVVTSDKSYQNNEWVYPYREIDALGGNDPYSASKSCQDFVVNSFRESYFSDSGVGISAVRAGNVIGGGDWAEYRIIPDLVRGIVKGETVRIRNPNSVRPWQHVLEPISGMLTLVKKMHMDRKFSDVWNFGPDSSREVTVKELAGKIVEYYGKGSYLIEQKTGFKEANYLKLDVSKAKKELGWHSHLDFESSLKNTVEWYKNYFNDQKNIDLVTKKQIEKYSSGASNDS